MILAEAIGKAVGTVLGLVILLCLILGPRAKWVKRILSSTANRIVFVLIVGAIVVAWIVEGVNTLAQGDRGGGYATLGVAFIFGAALYRFIHDWWLRTKGRASPS
jgi:hypothetical protein